MRVPKVCVALAAMGWCTPVAAQVTVSGTSRIRAETIDGQARAGFN